jgi:hypothetical protein
VIRGGDDFELIGTSTERKAAAEKADTRLRASVQQAVGAVPAAAPLPPIGGGPAVQAARAEETKPAAPVTSSSASAAHAGQQISWRVTEIEQDKPTSKGERKYLVYGCPKSKFAVKCYQEVLEIIFPQAAGWPIGTKTQVEPVTAIAVLGPKGYPDKVVRFEV